MSLYLIDGHALAYRSYYAFIRSPLVNSRGEETSAVFGFLKTVLSILERFSPTHIAAVFDEGEKTFRNEMFAEYKANRPKMPESLAAQLPRIIELVEAMSITVLSKQGYEADDIIATLTQRMQAHVPVRIVSGDKDLFQVVGEGARVIRPGKGGLLGDEMGPREVHELTGLRPEQFIDFQALMGDATDNVPGVPGVGQKTALKLMLEFGSLDNIYDNVDAIESAALRKKLITGREQAFLSRKLVRLDCAVPIEVSMESLARRPFDGPALRPILRDLGFSQILESLDLPRERTEAKTALRYRLVTTEVQLSALAERLGGCEEFAVDVECSELDPMRAVLAGISIAIDDGCAWYVPVTSTIDEDEGELLLTPPRESPGLPLEMIRRHLGGVFADASVHKVGQNIKYDTIVLANAGLVLDGISFDTMLASYCLDPGRRSHGLDSLVEEFFDHEMMPFKDLFEPRTRTRDIRLVPLERVGEYACEDADYTWRLKGHFEPLLQSSQVSALFENVEMPLSSVLTDMEMCGVALDVPCLKELADQLDQLITDLQKRIFKEVGEEFNINSTVRLQEVLFKKLGLKPTHRTKSGYSTDIEVLKALASQHVVPELLIEYRTLTKLKGTYVDALPRLVNPRTGRVHTSYNQAVTITGRLSSSDPNLQNIPIRSALGREIRKAFVAGSENSVLLDADYSQIELRIMAHLSQDAEMVRAFAEGADIHRLTAARIMAISPQEVTDEMRSQAKTVNFGIIYGMGARGLAQSLSITTEDAKKFIDDYFESYPGVRRFIDETIEMARRDQAVSTMLGRVRQLRDIDSGERRSRAFAERTAVNTPIQGTAADIIKVAMVTLHEQLLARGLKARMILQVHDELMLDVPRDELDEVKSLVRGAMENALTLDVPLKVDMGVGDNWLEAHG